MVDLNNLRQGTRDARANVAPAPPRVARAPRARAAAGTGLPPPPPPRPAKVAKKKGGNRKRKAKKSKRGAPEAPDPGDPQPGDDADNEVPDIYRRWHTFMTRQRQLSNEYFLWWRPHRSRALYIFEQSNAIEVIMPPTRTLVPATMMARWVATLNEADIRTFGLLRQREAYWSIVDPNFRHCDLHSYYGFILHRLWDEHIARLGNEANITAEMLDRQAWLKLRAHIQQYSLEHRDRWLIPNDPDDDPEPENPNKFMDGFDFKTRAHQDLQRVCRGMLSRGVRFDGQQVGLTGRWSLIRELGSGACGTAFLWGKYDSMGRLIDRVAAKDMFMPTDQWVGRNNESEWKVDAAGNHEPTEAFILDRLRPMAARGAPIIRYRGLKVDDLPQMYRVYLEFAPFGDLLEAVWNHVTLQGRRDQNGVQVERRIPESALWAIFERLVDAACVPARGCRPGDPAPAGGWAKEILHIDLKPENVFLSYPENDVWPNYPVFKMGDFGHADETFTADPRNPGRYPDVATDLFPWGTPGWMAPEQDAPLRQDRLGAGTNVFQIANIVVQAMNLYHGDVRQMSEFRASSRPVPNDPGNYYSYELKYLLQKCLHPNQHARPRPAVLREAIKGSMALVDAVNPAPMRTRALFDDFLHYSRADPYKCWIRT